MFSIITPVFNREDCIVDCINSVVDQKKVSFEMIIVDDGSTDNTLCLINNESEKNANIKVIHYKDNKGVNYARNRGIENACGKFIIFLDSDDQLLENALEVVRDTIEENNSYSHYLFGVSDRKDDINLPKALIEFKYEDWLSGKVSGDFTHIIKPECFKNLPFIEEFRIFESLGWLRVLRQNQKQLYIPQIIADRNRERVDSVTKEGYLDNKRSMLANFNMINQFINYYGDDMRKNELFHVYNAHITKGIFLGLALGKTKQVKQLISGLHCGRVKRVIYYSLNIKLFAPLYFFLITRVSRSRR